MESTNEAETRAGAIYVEPSQDAQINGEPARPFEQGGHEQMRASDNTGMDPSRMIEKARDKVKSQLTTGKEQASGNLGSMAGALRETARQLQEKGQTTAGTFADAAADQFERIAGYLRGRDLEQISKDTQDFARRQPTVFLTAAFFLGVLAARFVKSSRQYG